MTEAPTNVFPGEELLEKFKAIRYDDLRSRLVNALLEQWGVDQIAKLPLFAAEHLYAHLTRPEQGLRVTTVPSTKDYDKMTERNKRRYALRHMRVIGIENMMLDDFEKLAMTDQFLFVKERIPAGHMPISIERWFADAPAS